MQKEVNKIVLINEKVSFFDLVFKYTLRDFFVGLLSYLPGTVGLGMRMLTYKLILASCGRGFMVKPLVTIKFPERVNIGNHVGISEYSLVDGDGRVTIGNYVRIASHVSIIAFNHVTTDTNTPIKLQGKSSKGITIGDDCWIGTGARILDGVTLGHGTVVAAGAVVTKNTEPYSIVAGVPARVIKKRSNDS